MLRLLIALLLCTGCLQAGLADFPDRTARRTLFSQAEPAEPVTQIDTGHFGLSAWVCPFLRFPIYPDGNLGAVGLEFSYLFNQTLGVTAGVSGVGGDVYVETGHYGRYRTIAGFEAEIGFRVRMLRWDGGALYADARAGFGAYDDGGSAIKSTSAIGGGVHFGCELGSTQIRGFLEGGIDFRIGLNRGSSGWLETGGSFPNLGVHFELLRVGLRVYL
ncbi:MAG: hypothetical protein H6839_00785 [Planctomycetes bacterium]|nr:hypothetical protein [Planctomycetota bacterium]